MMVVVCRAGIKEMLGYGHFGTCRGIHLWKVVRMNGTYDRALLQPRQTRSVDQVQKSHHTIRSYFKKHMHPWSEVAVPGVQLMCFPKFVALASRPRYLEEKDAGLCRLFHAKTEVFTIHM